MTNENRRCYLHPEIDCSEKCAVYYIYAGKPSCGACKITFTTVEELEGVSSTKGGHYVYEGVRK